MNSHSKKIFIIILLVSMTSFSETSLETSDSKGGVTSSFQDSFQVCEIPQIETTFLRSVFLGDYTSFTCPLDVKDIVILDELVAGFNAKIEALLGQKLSLRWIQDQDPYAELDFSKAPQLKEIFIASLVFKKDFSGTVMERLLRFHAQRGVEVKVLTSHSLAKKKDRQMLEKLDDDFEKVQVVFYKYKAQNILSPLDWFRTLHRSQHVKMFVTSQEDGSGTAIVGGRNFHDGFLFNKAPELTRFLELIQYKSPATKKLKQIQTNLSPCLHCDFPVHFDEEAFVKWTDIDLQISSKTLLKAMRLHFSKMWNFNRKDLSIESVNKTYYMKSDDFDEKAYFKESKTYIRHFISSPYTDNSQLEKLYVDLIDSAEKTIVVSTPYFNLTKKLKEAFQRAAERKVKVKIVTRLDLEGDTIAIILSEVNKNDINLFYKNFEIYDFTAKGDILHSKVLLIDGEVSSVGAVNLNNRSFLHDIENTFVIWSPSFHDQMKEILEGYFQKSRPINQKLDQVLWKQAVISIFDKAF